LASTLSATISFSPGPTFPSGATPACSLVTPFSSFQGCSLSGFTVTDSDLTSTGNLIVQAYASNGGVTDYTNSNALPVSLVGYRQLTNLSGAAGTSDAINFMIAYNNKLIIMAGTGAAIWDGLYTYDGTTLKRISNVGAGYDQLAVISNNKL